MALQNHGNLFQGRISSPLANAINGYLHLSRSIHHATKSIGGCHSQVIVTMGRDDGIVYSVYMVYQILDFLAILLRQAIARGIGNVNHRGSSLNHGLYHTCQVFIIRTPCVFGIKLHVFHILLGIFHGSHGTFDDFLTSGVKLIFNMVIRCSYARMNTLVLGIFQGLGCKVYIFLYGTCQGTNSRPRHRLGNFYY